MLASRGEQLLPTIPDTAFPAVRQPEDFLTGAKIEVFVPRTWDGRPEINEASPGLIVDAPRFVNSPLGVEREEGDNSCTGMVKVMAGGHGSELPKGLFVSGVTNAGVVLVEHAEMLINDELLQEQWFDGAEWPSRHSWPGYIGLLSAAVARRKLAISMENTPDNKARRHARSPTVHHRNASGKGALAFPELSADLA